MSKAAGIIAVLVIVGLFGYWVYGEYGNKVVESQNTENTDTATGKTDTMDGAENKEEKTNMDNTLNTNNQEEPKVIIKNDVPGTGPEAKDGDIVSVLYTGKLEDGTVFDASEKHGGEPIEFTLGTGRVIAGWEQGILGMKVGGTRTLVIPSELAYGDRGIPGTIPPGATLVFDVELVGIR